MNESQPNSTAPGQLVIISGPSGVGKTSVLRLLFENCPLPLIPSVSATTRPQRVGETEGSSYHYLTAEEFQRRRERGDFLECVEVFGRGHWYGTLREPVATSLKQGKWIVLEIDVVGAAKVLQYYPESISIFIHPGSLTELERRLRGRGTESETALSRRLEVARSELDASSNYQHIVTNLSVEQTATDICKLLQQVEKKLNV